MVFDIGTYFLPIKYYKYFRLCYAGSITKRKYLKNNFINKYKKDVKTINKLIKKKLHNVKSEFNKILLLKSYLDRRIPYEIKKISNICHTHYPILSFLVDKKIEYIKIIRVRTIILKECNNCRLKYFKGCNECKFKKENVICHMNIDKTNIKSIKYLSKDMYEIECVYPFLYFLQDVDFRIETNNDDCNIYCKRISINQNDILKYISSLDFKYLTYQGSDTIIKKWN